MDFQTRLVALLLALGMEAAFGYPDAVYKRIGHPVTWIGSLIAALDRWLNRESFGSNGRRAAGVAATFLVALVAAVPALILERLAETSWAGSIAIVFAAAALFASRSLYSHVSTVASDLESGDLRAARLSVGRVVGRRTEALDTHGVARAAIESLAENASDGVAAPVFWFAVLGLPGLAVYKAINTADSMIGHRTDRYEAFGWAAARLDDLLNLPASRLTGLTFAAAASLTRASGSGSIAAMRRDARKHSSPNAGWPESAMAGALGLKLNGPKDYDGEVVGDAYMGDGRRAATAADVRKALHLATVAWVIMIAVVAMFAVSARA